MCSLLRLAQSNQRYILVLRSLKHVQENGWLNHFYLNAGKSTVVNLFCAHEPEQVIRQLTRIVIFVNCFDLFIIFYEY